MNINQESNTNSAFSAFSNRPGRESSLLSRLFECRKKSVSNPGGAHSVPWKYTQQVLKKQCIQALRGII